MSDDERINLAVTLPPQAAEKFLTQSGGIPAAYAEARKQVQEVDAMTTAQKAAFNELKEKFQ